MCKCVHRLFVLAAAFIAHRASSKFEGRALVGKGGGCEVECREVRTLSFPRPFAFPCRRWREKNEENCPPACSFHARRPQCTQTESVSQSVSQSERASACRARSALGQSQQYNEKNFATKLPLTTLGTGLGQARTRAHPAPRSSRLHANLWRSCSAGLSPREPRHREAAAEELPPPL